MARAVDSFSSKGLYTLDQLLSMYKDKKDDMYILYLQLRDKRGRETKDSLKVLSTITPKNIPSSPLLVAQWYRDRITEMITVEQAMISRRGKAYLKDVTDYVRHKARTNNPLFYNSWENEFPPQEISVVGNTIWEGSIKTVYTPKGKYETDIFDPDNKEIKEKRKAKKKKYRKSKQKVIDAIKRKRERAERNLY